MKKLIVIDFDSTLVNNETIDELAKEANKEKEIKEITKLAMNGKIDYRDSLIKRVELIKGLDLEKVNRAISRITLTKGAEDAIKELKKRGYIVAVVSGGFDIAIKKFKDLGIDYIIANELILKDNKVVGVKEKVIDKGKIIDKLMKKEKIDKDNIVVVGDGANDLSMFKKAGLRIAFCAKPILKKEADIIIENRDLREILKYV
ncbi:phosphoserine phosphatase SerB [Methanocaldococcus indicus]|uniref:phosphoserine phosphatase SerB n=1 Tax=Methanocaldococcus indicus TaxID=213231 RepID=UPI003C6D69BC